MAIVDELITVLGLRSDTSVDKESKKLNTALSSIRDTAAKVGAGLLALQAGVTAWTVSVAAGADEGVKFARSIGESFEAIQELEYATQRSGGSVSELRGDLERLTKTMESPVPGEFNQTLALLGIRTRTSSGQVRKSTDVLEDLAVKFEGLNKQERFALADRLGLSKSTVLLLNEGRASIAQLREESRRLGGIISTEDAKNAETFNGRLLDLQQIGKGVGNTIAFALIPAITSMNEGLRDFFLANRDIIATGLTQFVDGLTQGFSNFFAITDSVVSALSDLVTALLPAGAQIDAVQAIAVGTTGALVALAAAVISASAPFLAMAAAVAAVVLVIEDLWSYFQGGDSIIGGFIDAAIADFEKFQGEVEAIVNSVKGFIDGIGESITGAVEGIKGLGSDIADSLSSPLDAVSGFFGSDNSVPVSPSAASAAGNSTTNITQNINGAGDPRVVGQEIVNRAGLAGSLQTVTPSFNRPAVS